MPKMKKNVEFDFEQGLLKLEKIVEHMEQGHLTLEASLDQFGQGVRLLQQCQTTLEKAEQRVQVLLRRDQKTILEPFPVHEGVVAE